MYVYKYIYICIYIYLFVYILIYIYIYISIPGRCPGLGPRSGHGTRAGTRSGGSWQPGPGRGPVRWNPGQCDPGQYLLTYSRTYVFGTFSQIAGDLAIRWVQIALAAYGNVSFEGFRVQRDRQTCLCRSEKDKRCP